MYANILFAQHRQKPQILPSLALPDFYITMSLWLSGLARYPYFYTSFLRFTKLALDFFWIANVSATTSLHSTFDRAESIWKSGPNQMKCHRKWLMRPKYVDVSFSMCSFKNSSPALIHFYGGMKCHKVQTLTDDRFEAAKPMITSKLWAPKARGNKSCQLRRQICSWNQHNQNNRWTRSLAYRELNQYGENTCFKQDKILWLQMLFWSEEQHVPQTVSMPGCIMGSLSIETRYAFETELSSQSIWCWELMIF